MVSVMLELLRVLATSYGPLEHPIVFLFNDAEEDGLFASHGFVRQHKWAKKCKYGSVEQKLLYAYILIWHYIFQTENCELLFRSAANSTWLINYYSPVPHPFANVLVEELFQYNLIPSETDFGVFGNYGVLIWMLYFINIYIQNKYCKFVIPTGLDVA